MIMRATSMEYNRAIEKAIRGKATAAEQEALNIRIAELQETLHAEQQAAWQISSFLQQVKKHTEITELNATILRELISKIKVYNAHKDEGGKRVQRITIEYNFIGEIYIPDEEQKETA